MTPRRLFLIDAFGAVVSAVATGLVLPRFEREVGVPASVLRSLALPALGFAAYSFVSAGLGRRGLLLGIALANSAYAVVTIGVLIAFRESLSWIGAGYFLGELAILGVLIRAELRLARDSASPRGFGFRSSH
jgi:hypothetical protein